jgi:type II secretory pathway component PulF
MPTFQYQSMTAEGTRQSGLITAQNRADAVRQLLGRGETATSISTAGELSDIGDAALATDTTTDTTTDKRARRGSMSRSEMATLIRELATALEAGLPLMQSLKTIRKQASGKGAPQVLDHMIERVEAGEPLYKAAIEYGPPFDDLVIGMLRAAEASGRTPEILHQLAELLDRSIELRREVMGALFYPFLVALLIIASVVILVTVVIPRVMEPIIAAGGGEASLPMPTQIVLGLANFIGGWWWICLISIAVGWYAWNTWVAVPLNRLRYDRFKLRIPLIGRLGRDVAVARFTRTLGTLTSAGLPILESLRITRDTLGNKAMMQAIDQVESQVTEGKPLADPLEQSGLFPPLLVQVVNLGERSDADPRRHGVRSSGQRDDQTGHQGAAPGADRDHGLHRRLRTGRDSAATA